MSFDSQVKSRLAALVTSQHLQSVQRRAQEVRRRLRGADHEVHYFHDVADPYCHLTAQVLERFQARYNVRLRPHLILGPPADAVPEPHAHRQNALTDAVRLAQKLGLKAPQHPNEDAIGRAMGAVAAILDTPDFPKHLSAISAALWSGQKSPDQDVFDPSHALQEGDQTLAALGHYLGGTFFYGGEWYWGVDRLHYLEGRLQQAGLGAHTAPLVAVPQPSEDAADVAGEELEFFFSFRSPYSYLAFDRVQTLASRLGARLNLRPVLPMLMRGLPVPKDKSGYILHDCVREARRLGIPFGRICDPLGAGVERGYALFDYADDQDEMAAYCSAFMRCVWSEGVDAATDKGMARIVSEAGLDWDHARPLLTGQSWRSRIEANQNRLQQIGLWGVPSFHVNGHSVWGQDRLWVVDDVLRT